MRVPEFCVYLHSRFIVEARMAESVDALVSNTNDSNVVPVRPRLRVQRGLKISPLFFLLNLLQNQTPPFPKFERPPTDTGDRSANDFQRFVALFITRLFIASKQIAIGRIINFKIEIINKFRESMWIHHEANNISSRSTYDTFKYDKINQRVF